VRLEDAERPTPERRPDRYVDALLALLPGVLTATAADLNAVRAAELQLEAARTRVPAGAAELAAEHAAAAAAIAVYLEPLSRDAHGDPATLVHTPECSRARGVETASQDAETPYGRCVVRVARCVSCGASGVVNRRLIVAVDPSAVAAQRRAREERETGSRLRRPARRSKFA